MNDLQIFTNPEFGEVRTVTINSEPWLVGKDVAEALGYADPNKAIAMHVDDEDKLNDKMASSLGRIVRKADVVNEGVDQPLLVGFVLLVRGAPELLQHEEQLIAGIDGSGRRFLDGFHAIAQSGFLLFQFAQPGDD